MSWFTYLQNRRDAGDVTFGQDREAGSPTDREWEVLNRSADKLKLAEDIHHGHESPDTSDAEFESASEDDESLSVIGEASELKKQIAVLQKGLAHLQKDKESVEARLRKQEGEYEGAKEKSKQMVIRFKSELQALAGVAQKKTDEIEALEKNIARMDGEATLAREQSQQALARAQQEIQGRQLTLGEYSRRATSLEEENARLKSIVKEVQEEAKVVGVQAGIAKKNLARVEGENATLQEQSLSLDKAMEQLQDESQVILTQNAQALAMLGVRTLEPSNFANPPDLVADADLVKMVERLNSEIYETAAYMADSFDYGSNLFATAEMKETYVRVNKMMGSSMVRALASVRHDEDPVLVQIACQACMVEYCQRVIGSWCFDGSKSEHFLSDLYSKIRKSDSQPGAVSGRWRALTRTLVRSMHTAPSELPSRLVPVIVETLLDILLASGVQGTRSEVQEKLTSRFNQRMGVIARLALRLNEVVGEQITSSDMKVTSVPHGATFTASMEDGYNDENKEHTDLRVLCTTEIGLHKEVKRFESQSSEWTAVTLVKPKVALESLTKGMPQKEVRRRHDSR